MDLYLVRHALAHDRSSERWPNDADRPLTPEGEKAFLAAARGLKQVARVPDIVLSSSFARAWRTAELLTQGAGWPEPESFRPLEADRPATEVVPGLASYAGHRRVALVGHEPGMGELAWLLLEGSAKEDVIRFKKGAVARIDAGDPPAAGGGVLRWLIVPKALRKG
ncbi:MAG TPA: histidine phosphatase family protein [Actinomycetota bacterium]